MREEAGCGGEISEFYLNQALGLKYLGQDWGIVNADERRLVEFIHYYSRRRDKLRIDRGCLEELICAWDEALGDQQLDDDTVECVNEIPVVH